MSQQERRKHARYLLHLPIRLHCEGRELKADVINASAGGCLLRMSEPLAPGDVLEASIPELKIPRTRLIVVRCHADPSGYLVATYFEATLADDAAIRQFAGGHGGSSKPPLLH
ncbi:PilZ domain-containing protein [Hyalangium versicolor]|uniref:PilZ domain-containing protein n=1 Tax=Hyalangium versicolor TaxID=2861190 RepID=UPI001CCFB725|nr:PilZ domain-containing protein [Hyalangium versicolor]